MTDEKSLLAFFVGFVVFLAALLSAPLWNPEILILRDLLVVGGGFAMGGGAIRDQMIKDFRIKINGHRDL